MYQYQQDQRYFGQIAGDLVEQGMAELAELGGSDLQSDHRGVLFSAESEALYRINYQSRLFTRILAPVRRFRCHDRDHLYRIAAEIEWRDFFSSDHTFAVFANVNHSHILNSQFASLCVKDAVADYFRKRFGKRPNVDKFDPDLTLNLHIENNVATISVDTSGGSLHRRGYRKEPVATPMQETLAAAIIRLTGWDGEKPLLDPMCGSGTLVSEALMKYCRLPAGLLRKRFGFEFLPDFDKRAWGRVKAEAEQVVRDLPEGLISCGDISSTAVRATRINLNQLPFGKRIRCQRRDFLETETREPSVIVCNPPYGIRKQEDMDPETFYSRLGDVLKQRCPGSEAYIYVGDRDLIRKVGLHPTWKIPLKNGGLDGRLVKYELY